jgi:hypothetical protein
MAHATHPRFVNVPGLTSTCSPPVHVSETGCCKFGPPGSARSAAGTTSAPNATTNDAVRRVSSPPPPSLLGRKKTIVLFGRGVFKPLTQMGSLIERNAAHQRKGKLPGSTAGGAVSPSGGRATRFTGWAERSSPPSRWRANNAPCPEQPFSPALIADAETPAFRGRLSARLSASRRWRSGPRSLSASGLQRTAGNHVVVLSGLSGADKRRRRAAQRCFVAKLPGSMYATQATKAGPRNGSRRNGRSPRRDPLAGAGDDGKVVDARVDHRES